MGQEPHVIKERNERNRELLADDIAALSDKLNVKKQATLKKDEVVDNIKEKIGMSGNGSSGPDSRAKQESSAALAAVKGHPVATVAMAWGAKRLLQSWGEKREEKVRDTDTQVTYGVVAVERPPVTPLGGTAEFTGAREVRPGTTDDQDGSIASKAGEAVGSARAKVGDVMSSVKDTVAGTAGDVKEKASGTAGGAREKVGGATSTAKDKVTGVTGAASGKVTQMGSAAKRELPTSRTELEQMVRSHPALVGVGAFAVGAAVAALVPKTRLENEHLAEKREELLETAKERALEARDAVEAGMSTAIEEGREALSTVVGEAKDAVQTGVQETKSAVQSGVEEAKDEMKSGSSDSSSSQPSASGQPTTVTQAAQTTQRPGPILGSREQQRRQEMQATQKQQSDRLSGLR